MKSTQDNKQAVMSAMSNIKCDWFEGFPMFIQPETCSTVVAHDIRHQRKMAAMWTLMCWIIHPQTKRRLLRGITVLVTRCSDFLESYRHVEVDRCGIIVPSEIDTCPHCLYLATWHSGFLPSLCTKHRYLRLVSILSSNSQKETEYVYFPKCQTAGFLRKQLSPFLFIFLTRVFCVCVCAQTAGNIKPVLGCFDKILLNHVFIAHSMECQSNCFRFVYF